MILTFIQKKNLKAVAILAKYNMKKICKLIWKAKITKRVYNLFENNSMTLTTYANGTAWIDWIAGTNSIGETWSNRFHRRTMLEEDIYIGLYL